MFWVVSESSRTPGIRRGGKLKRSVSCTPSPACRCSAGVGALTRPLDVDFFLGMETPHRQPTLRQTNDGGQTLGFGVELPVTQQATNKGGRRILPHVHTHQAVPRMTQLTSIEVQVEGKEGGAT